MSASVSVGACEFTACASLNSLPSMHRHRPARWVVTLLARELKTANDKSCNNRKIIHIWLVSRVLHKQQSFPAPPACFPANMESICPPSSRALQLHRLLHTHTHTHTLSQSELKAGTVSPPPWHNDMIYSQKLIFWKPLGAAKYNLKGLWDKNVNEVKQICLSSQNNK